MKIQEDRNVLTVIYEPYVAQPAYKLIVPGALLCIILFLVFLLVDLAIEMPFWFYALGMTGLGWGFLSCSILASNLIHYYVWIFDMNSNTMDHYLKRPRWYINCK
eukprot:TRINITY_DN4627_c0_g1_i1.p1 TRINITY_DN4627_c0_g1~~TRINITY_DN4627_c0_g1_i1.p1  ORF type:complete len:105 (-),score=8.03 TRINITY_DN4627_c0_g1_i1:76-390(-)